MEDGSIYTSSLTYKNINNKRALKHMEIRHYEHLSYNDTLSLDHFKNTDSFGIFEGHRMCGLILIVKGISFVEPHIMLDELKRGKRGLALCKKFLKNKIKEYKMMIGRVPIDKKEALVFSKLTGFLPFKKTKTHILVGYGIQNEIVSETTKGVIDE